MTDELIDERLTNMMVKIVVPRNDPDEASATMGKLLTAYMGGRVATVTRTRTTASITTVARTAAATKQGRRRSGACAMLNVGVADH
jgi:hypothetical protein